MKIPGWFGQDGRVLFVRMAASLGKVKRIRNHAQVNIALYKMDGALQGDWVPASARIVTNPQIDHKVDRLLDRKYGLLKKLFYLAGGPNGRKYTTL